LFTSEALMSGTSTLDNTPAVQNVSKDVAAARAALAQALAEFLDPPRVDLALQLWRRRYEGDDSLFLRLTFYCREVVQQHGLAGQEANLHTAMLRAIQRSLPMSTATSAVSFEPTAPLGGAEAGFKGSAHVSVSASVAAPARKRAVPVAQTVPAELEPAQEVIVPPPRSSDARVLQAFYMALEAQLARQLPPGVTPARVRRTLIRHARALPHDQRHPVSLWWSGQVNVLEGEWPMGGQGSALVKVMHSALTELLGAAHAERCFKQATARLEASRDSTLHCIRRYL
jgi:hypothetical protein